MSVVVAVPDVVSPSYFPAIAAVRLGICGQFGVDARVEHVFPVTHAVAALAAGEFDFLAGAAHSSYALAEPDSVRVVVALSHGAYWFLVVRADLDGDFDVLACEPLRVGAAPGVDLVLRAIVEQVGVPAGRGLQIVPIPRVKQEHTSFGVGAAAALAAGVIDGFWANGMAAELAVRHGFGRVVLDARRDARFSGLTYPALMCSARTVTERPDVVAQMGAALREAQRVLTADPHRATEAAADLFPPEELSLIADLVRRDTPFYRPEPGSIRLPRRAGADSAGA